MTSRHRYGSLVGVTLALLAALALFAACGGSDDTSPIVTDGDGESADTDTEAEADPNALPFEPAGANAAPTPLEAGPFPVGVKTFDLYDATRPDATTKQPRHLRTEVWYPAVQAAKDMAKDSLDMWVDAKDVDLGDKREAFDNAHAKGLITPIPTGAVRDAAIDNGHGPYPVVIFSHGANGIRWQSIFYTVFLASHGYIVIAPDHEGNTLWNIIRDGYDTGSVVGSAKPRLLDVSYLLDVFFAKNADAADFFHGTMNTKDVGISGHSFGGLITIAAPCKDKRFKAGVAHAPQVEFGELLGGCKYDSDTQKYAFATPYMELGGTSDKTLPWHDQYCGYRGIAAPEQYLLEVLKAGHFTFSDICQLDLTTMAKEINFGNAEDALKDGCSKTDNVNWDLAHKTIDFYSVAFFNLTLRHSEGSRKYIAKQETPKDVFEIVNFYEGNDIPETFVGGTCASSSTR